MSSNRLQPSPVIPTLGLGSKIAGALAFAHVAVACSSPAFVDDTTTEIVGGTPATIDSFPWQVAIRLQEDPNLPSEQLCGGSILNEYWILTAAHCLKPRSTANLWIAAGISDGAQAGSTGQRREIDRRVIHESYRRPSAGRLVHGEYDIALLRLISPLDLSQSGVASIERVKPEEGALTAPGVLATVSGWGAHQYPGRPVDELHEVTIPIVSNEVARRAYPGNTISHRQLAVGLIGIGGKGACVGDSGGPLVVHDPGYAAGQACGRGQLGKDVCRCESPGNVREGLGVPSVDRFEH